MAAGELWPHQLEAVDAIVEAIGQRGRTSLVAACGTGKTRIGWAGAARLRATRLLVVVPTIELLTQTLRAYREAAAGPLGRVVAVCSDPTVAELQLLHDEPEIVVTTTATVLAEAIEDSRQVLALSTYASLPVVADAHAAHDLRRWDLVIVDEAHRTAGRVDGAWKTVHRDDAIPARRRLYMTATPRVAQSAVEDVVSMDDAAVFGEVAYRLPFSRAIDMGLLADYRVVVPVVTDQEVHRLAMDEGSAVLLGGSKLAPGALAAQIAVLRAMKEYGVRRAISYHHRVAEAKTWAQTLPAAAVLMPGGSIPLWAGHVSGVQPGHLRRRVLERLADPGPETVVVSNAKVLNEGIDVPAVDAVVFSKPRESAVDTIQAVGRALRTGGRTDKVATIVVPLLLSAGESPEAALEGSAWQPVWQVIRALRDHDDRLDEYLRFKRRQLGEGRLFDDDSDESKLPPWLHIQGVDVPDDFAEAITIRALRARSPPWEEFFGAARAYAYLHGHANVPGDWVSPGGLRVGGWISDQRKAFRQGRLTAERQAALGTINVVWHVIDDLWMTALAQARKYHAAHGNLDVRQDHVTADGHKLGQWLGWQRAAYHSGKLADDRVAALDELGMIWNRSLTAWQTGYNHARQYHDEHGDLLVPTTLKTASGYTLGNWVLRQRKYFEQGKLTAEQITMLDELGMVWRPLDQAWQDAFRHACAYRERNGHLDVPGMFVTSDGFRLGNWIGNQRIKYRDNALSRDKVDALEELGIIWNPKDAAWARGLAAARHYKDRNKDLRVHAKYITDDGYNLGGWIADQRKAYVAGRLSQDRVDRLNAIGMSWVPGEETFKTVIEQLRLYRAEHGNLDLPQDYMAAGINLYNWMGMQRTRRGLGKVPDDRIRQLDDIGFPWDAERDRWMRRYAEVSEAMGEVKSPRSLVIGSPEKIWLDNQAVAYRNNRLDPERRTMLEALGVTDNQLWTMWMSAYTELDAFRREEGHFRVPDEYRTIDGIQLAAWKNFQRTQWNRGRLSQEKADLLDKIDFPWDPYSENWDQRYDDARRHVQLHGRLAPSAQSNLGKWLLRQQRNVERGILNKHHVARLNQLDPQWRTANRTDETT